MSNETIIKYVKNRKGHPVGIVLATKTEDGKFSVGWSLCKTSDDVFNKKFGIEIAKRRAHANYDLKKIPHSVYKEWAAMTHRGAKYFKGCTAKYVI